MKNTFRCMIAIIAAFAGIAVLGTGVAQAKDALIGRSYAQAKEIIQERWNRTPVVASAVGSVLPLDECIVTAWHRPTTPNSMGRGVSARTVQVHLNCGSPLAEPGSPGNSATTPEGKAQLKAKAIAMLMKKKPEICEKNPDGCANFCDKNPMWCKEFDLPY